MGYEVIVQQTRMETEALGHITRALEGAIGWVVDDKDLSRKLSSVQFATELFQRQIEHLFALEECDGYMKEVRQLHPELTDRVEILKREHKQFRAIIRKLIARLERASPTDLTNLDEICEGIRVVMRQLFRHADRESDLIAESLNRSTWREG
jgi:hypothetical protein